MLGRGCSGPLHLGGRHRLLCRRRRGQNRRRGASFSAESSSFTLDFHLFSSILIPKVRFGQVCEGQRAFSLCSERSNCYEQQHFEWDPFDELKGMREKRKELLRNPCAFSIDLVPRLLYGRSEHVDVLIESGVARYLEFQGLKSTKVLSREGLMSVPLTKSEIFQDAHLSKAEKRP